MTSRALRSIAALVLFAVGLVSPLFAQTKPSRNTTAAKAKQEILKVDWPAEYKWRVGSDQDDGRMHMIEVVPGNETVENWSIIGSLIAIKGVTDVSMEQVLQGAIAQQQKLDSAAKLTLLARNDTAAHPWILFKIESPTPHDGNKPESQVFYYTQGTTSLFSGIVGIKEATLPDDFVNKWSAVFKTSRLSVE